MKRLLIALALLLTIGSAQAQNTQPAKKEFSYGLFNHLGVGVSAGTTGIGLNASTCITKWLSVRAGVNMMPAFKLKTDLDLDLDTSLAPELNGVQIDDQVSVEASFGRTTVDLIFDVYPFGSGFFVSGGFSFGGPTLLKIKGHSQGVEDVYRDYPNLADEIFKVADFEIPFDREGNIDGGVKVSGFRPYFGIGFGSRAVPKSRLGFRCELGLQIHGKPKVFGAGYDDLLHGADIEGSDDIAEVVDKVKVYPVLRVSLTGRIL